MAILNTAQENFSSLAEASPMPMAVYEGRDMRIIVANGGMLELWGKDSSILGRPLSEAVPELQGQKFLQLMDHVFQTGITYHSAEDPAAFSINGELRTGYFSYTYKALKDHSGQITGIIHTAVEITSFILARQQLSGLQEHLSFALSAAEIGTWDHDPMHNKVHWDKRCMELFAIENDHELGFEQVLSRVHPDEQQKLRDAVRRTLQAGSDGNYDLRYRTINPHTGTIRWVHCKGKAYFNAEGRPYRFAGIARDVTAEVNSRRREQQLLSLINNNNDNMSVAGLDGKVIYMNRAAREMLGIADDMDIETLNALSFYQPEELQRVQQEIIPLLVAKKNWQGHLNVMNFQTREVIPCYVNFILVSDPDTGEIIGRGATVRDLRPEIRAKAELQRLATLIDISEDFCNYCDLEGNTIYLNAAGLKLIGMAPGTATQYNMFDYHTEASSRQIKEEIVPRLLDTGRWTGTLELIHQVTGEIIPIHKQLFIIREPLSETPVALAGIARDLRPELKARHALDLKNIELQLAVKKLEFLANAVPAVVWTSNARGEVDYINQRWHEKSGLTITESLGNGWTRSLHPDDVAETSEAWRLSTRTGHPYEREFRLMDKTGEYRWWLVRALALRDDHGHIIKWYGSNTDITAQKELEHQKDNFLGVASHELKTPVTSVKAYVQVMEKMFRKSGDEKNAGLLAKMDHQLNRLTQLIADLLEVTKINTGRLQYTLTSFNFNEMVEEVIEEVQRTSGKHEIRAMLSFKRTIHGDRERICQVLINLLTNAIKYSPDASRIIVYTEDLGSEVQVCVQDFGIGISRSQQDKVFEQFYRVSGTREHTFPGLGLGLYISSEIVKHLNGKIWVDSVEGKGSTFCFSLPAPATP